MIGRKIIDECIASLLKEGDRPFHPSPRVPSKSPRVGDRIHGIDIGVGPTCSYTVTAVSAHGVTYLCGGEEVSTPLKQWERWVAGKFFTRVGEERQDWVKPISSGSI